MTRIIVDLTEFNTWSGHLTGVQRVVHGIAKALNNKEENVLFVRFSDRLKQFESVTFEQFTAITNEVKTVLLAGDSISTDTQRLRRLAKKAYNNAPLWVRNKLTPARKEKLLRNAKSLYHNAKSLRVGSGSRAVKINTHQFNFKRGDVIVSAGRAWDNEIYMSSLEALKREQAIEIAYVIYDLIPIYQQHTFGPGLTERFSKYLYRTLKNGDYLLPISESTKRDILKFAEEIGVFDLPVIETIRLGDEISETMPEIPPSFVRDPEVFAVSVGTIEARKNHMGIYYAYKLAHELGVELPDIYIIGMPGWLTSDVIYFIQNDITIKNKITIISNANDQDLAWLYKNALYTVYPSEYEGWGLPIAESLAYGTPVIASNTSSMTEISPNLVDHVSPFDSHELLDRMVLYSDKDVSKKRREMIETNYKPQSWDKTGSVIIQTIKH